MTVLDVRMHMAVTHSVSCMTDVRNGSWLGKAMYMSHISASRDPHFGPKPPVSHGKCPRTHCTAHMVSHSSLEGKH